MTNPAITVSVSGQQVIITAVAVNGTSTTIYSDAAASAAVTLPTTVSADTTYYMASGTQGYAIFSFREPDGTTLATEAGLVKNNHTLTVQPAPTTAQLLANASRREINVDYLYDGSPAFLRKNLRRQDCTGNLSALSTGVMTSVAIPLQAGDVVTNLTFVSGTTAAGTPTNWWFALYSNASTPALLAQTADQTSTAWAANTAKTVALSAAQTITTTGIYYAAVNVTATTPPTLTGASLHNAVEAGAIATGQAILAQTSGSSLTATAPATITSATTVATVPLVLAT